jgi:hypothetical protein
MKVQTIYRFGTRRGTSYFDMLFLNMDVEKGVEIFSYPTLPIKAWTIFMRQSL